MFCPKCGTPIDDNALFCPKCSASLTDQAPQQPNTAPNSPLTPTYELPMKWFKFLIWFSLWASAITNAVNAVQIFTGSIYGSELKAKLMYAVYGGLKTVDLLVGVASIAMAILAVYTRFRLSGFHKNGPKMVSVMYGANAVIQLLYVAGISTIMPSAITDDIVTNVVLTVATSFLMVVLNHTYFKKREHLFVN